MNAPPRRQNDSKVTASCEAFSAILSGIAAIPGGNLPTIPANGLE
jgi:hypothetical protein